MRVKCPHCQNALNVVGVGEGSEAACPSCGSRFPVLDVTVSYHDTDFERIGRFELIDVVGMGHFGTVWKAKDLRLDRLVAVKIPRAGELEERRKAMFLREARAAAALEHSNIVQIYEVGEEANQVYIVSQFINGVTLGEQLRIKRYSAEETARLMKIVAEAVHHAHDSGVIHRDLKPSNILLDTEGKPYVSDFGLAKLDSAEITVTISGVILGTPAYMSPEQARGDSHSADRRSDVYSLGVILYEMLTGKRPFEGSTSLLLHQIQSSDPRSPRTISKGIPRDLETICLKALAKSPDRRYATAQALADDLQRFLIGESIVARRVSRFERAWRWTRRNPLAVTTSALMLIAMFGMIGLLWARPSAPVAPTQNVRITTLPAGAWITLYPIDSTTGHPQFAKGIRPKSMTPTELIVESGDYFVVATSTDSRYTFHEVLRHVPIPSEVAFVNPYPHLQWKMLAESLCELPVIRLPEAGVISGMARIHGQADYLMMSGTSGASAPVERRVAVEDFYLDPIEVRVKDVHAVWPNSRRSPPFMISQMKQQPPPEDDPVGAASWHEAVAFAELVGKRLPTEAEYELAATAGGQQHFPWGDDVERITDWTFGASGTPEWDHLTTHPTVAGLYSNVAEWTASWPQGGMPVGVKRSEMRVVAGGGASIIGGTPSREDWSRGPRMRVSAPAHSWNKGLGFRCVRSARPFGGSISP